MRRVVVVGASCSGKTTLGRAIAQRLGIAHFEIDAMVWGPNWTLPPREVLLANVKNLVAGDAWVIDGVFPEHRDMVWARADTIIWLNYPMSLVFPRAFRRTIKRCITREKLGKDNVETWRRTFFSSRSQLLWVIHSWRKRRRDYPKIFRLPEFRHLRILQFQSPRKAETWLATLPNNQIAANNSHPGDASAPQPSATWRNHDANISQLQA